MLGSLLLSLVAVQTIGKSSPTSPDISSGSFPIAVWLQSPSNAKRYQAAGFNMFVGLWQGPTEDQLAELKRAGMRVVCEQNAVGLKHLRDNTVYGWMHGDEPDNAQEVRNPKTGKVEYGPCIPPAQIVSDYHRIKAADPSRPVMLNLGQGVANDEWVGRGSGASLKDYETYVQGSDIVSFDIYPIAGLPKPDPENYLWLIGKGLDRIDSWTRGKIPSWNCIECTRISSKRKATPDQVRSEVWMSIINGSKGLIYFVHQFEPSFNEHALLDDPEMLKTVSDLNHEIQSLAQIINSKASTGKISVSTSNKEVPVRFLAKKFGKDLYLFTIGMRNASTRAVIGIDGLKRVGRVEVVGENRFIEINRGQFTDGYLPYQAHIYRIAL